MSRWSTCSFSPLSVQSDFLETLGFLLFQVILEEAPYSLSPWPHGTGSLMWATRAPQMPTAHQQIQLQSFHLIISLLAMCLGRAQLGRTPHAAPWMHSQAGEYSKALSSYFTLFFNYFRQAFNSAVVSNGKTKLKGCWKAAFQGQAVLLQLCDMAVAGINGRGNAKYLNSPMKPEPIISSLATHSSLLAYTG